MRHPPRTKPQKTEAAVVVHAPQQKGDRHPPKPRQRLPPHPPRHHQHRYEEHDCVSSLGNDPSEDSSDIHSSDDEGDSNLQVAHQKLQKQNHAVPRQIIQPKSNVVVLQPPRNQQASVSSVPPARSAFQQVPMTTATGTVGQGTADPKNNNNGNRSDNIIAANQKSDSFREQGTLTTCPDHEEFPSSSSDDEDEEEEEYTKIWSDVSTLSPNPKPSCMRKRDMRIALTILLVTSVICVLFIGAVTVMTFLLKSSLNDDGDENDSNGSHEQAVSYLRSGNTVAASTGDMFVESSP